MWYEDVLPENQRKYNNEMEQWYKSQGQDLRGSDIGEDSDVELTDGFSLGYQEAGGSKVTLTMDREEARLFNPQMVFKNLITEQLESGKEGVYRTELWG